MMDPVILISILVGLVVVLLVVGAPLKPVRFLGNVAVKLVIGALMLFFVNAFGSFIDFHIPINGVTAAVSGILGVPGVVLLIVVKQFII
ncbi:pro-sigmaK processing inhibitor BofA family protein [Halalkalibacter kiskunsagensis]|uniref:Pro-sigmaK processing inhibitor BofA family protein n=1 Tax=Halalkalibacter kiskunsagensis TaxID=1548599 RepID=A0ABV6KAK8_9BACI